MGVEGHQEGGIIPCRSMGMVAEAGPEAIIPLVGSMRNRARDLWTEVGVRLGVLPKVPDIKGTADYQERLSIAPELPPFTRQAYYQADMIPLPMVPKVEGQAAYDISLGQLPKMSFLEGGAIYQAVLGTVPRLTGLANYQTSLESSLSIPELTGVAKYEPILGALPVMAGGGIVDYPVLAGEAGLEAIIPLSANYHAKALDLWSKTGEELGIDEYQEMGFVPRKSNVALAGNTEVKIDLGGINIGPISATDLEAVEEKVHNEVSNAFRKVIASLQNRA